MTIKAVEICRCYKDRKLVRLALSILRICLALYLFLLLYAIFFSERQIFLPPRPPSWSVGNLPDLIRIEVEDGENVCALHRPAAGSKFAFLYSHGNAEDIGDVAPFLDEMNRHGYSVFAYDYRGYGLCDGSPSEKNAYKDAEAAYRYMTETLKIPPERIIAHGRSLGGALAVEVASKNKVAGLIMESSFETAFHVAIPFTILPFDRMRNIDKIRKVNVPVLVIHGTKEEVIPLNHGLRLFAAANEPKTFYKVDGAGHNNLHDVAGERYWEEIRKFTESIKSVE